MAKASLVIKATEIKRYFTSHGFQISFSSFFLSKEFKTLSIAEQEEIKSIKY